MKKFRELFITPSEYPILDLINKFSNVPNIYWKRELEKETFLNNFGKMAFCFGHEESNNIQSANLFLFSKNNDTWYVSNIVPNKKNELSIDEYNDVLYDFYNKIVTPSIVDTPVQVEITKDNFLIEDIIGIHAFNLLKKFSNLANKSTGSAHPLDRARWFDFILLINKQNIDLDVKILIAALSELGWSDERAYELAEEFEFSNELLDYKKSK